MMTSKFKDLPDISTTQPDRLIKYRVSEDRFSAEVLLPGLAYTDFDQKIGGKLSLWSMTKLFEGIRWQALIHGYFYQPKLRKERNKMQFVASQTCTLTEKMHYTRYDNTFGLNKPLLACVYVANIGSSSFTHVVDLYEYQSREKLGTFVTVGVYMNALTRRPHPLPAFSFENFEEHARNLKRQTIEKPKIPVIPSDAFKYTVKALHSDSDINQHVTQSTYIRWCSDASSMGAHKGYFTNFKKHIELYPLKNSLFQFVGESVVNDILTVNVWENDGNNKALHFAITKNGKIIYIMTMEFYEGEPIRLAPHLEAKL